jgi:AcrR family transcriptional regulator
MARSASPTRPRGRPRAAERPSGSSAAELRAAAAELFVERGFEATSVREICERAGLSKGSFYWAYESKDELFLAVVEERIEGPIREAIEMLRRSGSEQDMSTESNRRLLEAMRRDRDATLLDDEYWRRALRDPEVRARYSRRQRDLREALGEALEERRRTLGSPSFDTPPLHLAIGYLSLMSGIARSRVVDPEAMPDDLFGEFLAITYAGLVARANT